MNDAAIVGYGYVGRATAKGFGIDKYYDLKGHTVTLEDASKCRVVFLCLPTPTVDGECDISATRDVIGKICSFGSHPLFVIRSTVIPGTARKLMAEFDGVSIVSNPEFLSENTWEQDAINPRMAVIGADDEKSLSIIRAIYEGRWKGVQIFQTDTITAETLKYAFNSFFATKVVFANGLADVCKRIGANYRVIREALEFHPWGSKNHFKIWHKGGRGAGGACLPKDLQAFAQFSQDFLISQVERINKELLKTYPKDYERKQ